MIDLETALDKVSALFSTLNAQEVSLKDAHGRILARDALAKRDQPPFAASAMDGYALRSKDVKPYVPLRVIGQSVAGRGFEGSLGARQAVRIFTGAPVPIGADRILIQEDCTRQGDEIIPNATVESASFIRAQGADFKAAMRLCAGTELNAHYIGLLAAMNVAKPWVYRRPKIALIATGDELVDVGDTAARDQIICSNSYALAALVAKWGGVAHILPIARDNLDSLRRVIDMARDCDGIITIGGASVGEHDLVAQVASDMGAKLDFHRIAMRPGKPVFAGWLGDTPLLGLPGNPVSAIVCAHVFLRPALALMQGQTRPALPFENALLGADVPPNGARAHFMRAKLEQGVISAFERQDSALLSVLVQANTLLYRAPNAPTARAGDQVPFLRM